MKSIYDSLRFAEDVLYYCGDPQLHEDEADRGIPEDERRDVVIREMIVRGHAVPVDVTEAVDLYWSYPKEDWTHKDFPSCRSPFNIMLMEYRHLKHNPSRLNWEPDEGHRLGLLVGAWREKGEENTTMMGYPLLCLDRRPIMVGWLGIGFAWVVDADGNIIPSPAGSTIMVAGRTEFVETMQAQGLLNEDMVNEFLFAISMMNCKNIELAPSHYTKKVKGRRGEKARKYRVRRYTLAMRAMRRAIDEKGATSGLKNAVHLCRGHFKTFTKDKPLLGKAVGTFWWGQQMRGSKDVGKVEKGYKI